tara:strand:- start:984 stop:1433 length:450 start_codon:yes stop_codon:yes gene_type:complete
MRYRNIFLLFLSLGIFLTFKSFKERKSVLINVQGSAQLLSANIQKGDSTSFSSKPIKASQILAISGKVKSIESDVLTPLETLPKAKLTTYTNSKGVFKFNLKPGIYTFFIINDNYAYLNSFDGKGYYKSYKISSDIDDILIVMTADSYF